MPKSTITSKHQTTVPRSVRERLGLAPGDVLQWDVVGDAVRVKGADRAFLRRRGMVRVGRGSPVADVAQARSLRGSDRE